MLSLEVAKRVKKVYAIDVSREITKGVITPGNFELIVSDGCSIPVPERSVSVAYSNQLMEHLHPDDALEQLRNIYKALAGGGHYICVTPNRLRGPSDISRYFDKVATGFHLKEYTLAELCKLFRAVGFSKLSAYVAGKDIYVKCPLFVIKLSERVLSMLPFLFRQRIAKTVPFRLLLGIILVGAKTGYDRR